MKIGMQTWGSHGDIRPFLALAEGLQEAGHDVTLAITCVDDDRHERLHSGAGVTIRSIASPVIADPALLKEIGETLLGEKDPIRQTQRVIESLFLPAEQAMFEASEQLCRENDVVIGHFFHYPLVAAAASNGRPHVSVVLNHGALPSAFQPPAGVPDLGAFGNRLAWRLARMVLNRRLKKYSDRLRTRHGIPAARDLIDDVWASNQLTLLAISPVLCTRRPDWPEHHQVCGVLEAQVPLEGGIPERLRAFLCEGAPPVWITFGSMISGSDEKRTIALLTDAARKADTRAVIQAPRWRELGFVPDDAIHYVESAAHAEVFPQCSLVVHHGGAGTTHAALRAARPSVVVAHTAEQEFWGRELERVGAAPRFLVRRTATAEQIAACIRQVAGSKEIIEQACRLGRDMDDENGVATATRLINDRFAVSA